MMSDDVFEDLAKENNLLPYMMDVRDVSHELEFSNAEFLSNGFQSYVATQIIADPNRITTVRLPTGVGKSFIAALVASYYQREHHKRVAIVTSETFLVRQLTKMLGDAR